MADMSEPAGVTADDIRASIEIVLGRTPDQSLIDYHLTLGFADRIALGRYMLSTDEFTQRYLNGNATSEEPLEPWAARAHHAEQRRLRLKSFGPRARGVAVSLDDGLFIVDPEDGFVATSLLHHGRYSSAEVDFDISLLTPSSRVLVVGTHIGALAIPLASRCAHVTAIEANPQSFELLAANVRLSGVTNMDIHNVAAGEEDGREIEFLVNRDNSGGSKIKPLHSPGEGYYYDNPEVIRISTVRMDTLLRDREYDFVMIDIEGSEVFALRGMPAILQNCDTLAVEFRPHSLIEVAGVELTEFLRPIQPHFKWLYVPGMDVVPIESAEAVLRPIYASGACYDAIYFFNNLPDVLK